MSSVKELDHLRIPLKEIESATNNFDDESFIGEGGFGRVYKAELSHNNDRIIVTIKRLDRASQQGPQDFLTEIAMLSDYKHKNLESLLGFCDEGGEKILVYRYETNGSLDKYLRNDDDGYDLTWIQRLNICIGAARGLEYLHNGVGPEFRVIHHDIKSSNILLDENWEAKIADFGLSKIGPANQEITFLVTNPTGTGGYCDPQYCQTGVLTKESDVYSFGVVLFEVLCGRPACIADEHGARQSLDRLANLSYECKNLYSFVVAFFGVLCGRPEHDERQSLARLAKLSYERKNLYEIIDRNIFDQIHADSYKMFSEVAYQCLQEDKQKRPTMTQVVTALEIALEFQPDKPFQPSTSVHLDCPPFFIRDVGVCYGHELPLPSEVIRLCKSHNIQHMRLFSPNQAVLESLRGSDIQVILGVPNSDIEHVASSLDNAQKWVQENVIEYWPDVRFRYIVVGNEDDMDGGIASQIQYLYRAMMNLNEVIELNGLQGAINVSTAFDYFTLWLNPDGPIGGEELETIQSFFQNNEAPMLIKLYPYSSYGSTPGVISLPHPQFPIVQYDDNSFSYGSTPGVILLYGPMTTVQYDANNFRHLFGKMRDALYSSLEKALEAGDGSLDLEEALKAQDLGSYLIFKAVEPGICFRGDKYIFCFFCYASINNDFNIACIL